MSLAIADRRRGLLILLAILYGTTDVDSLHDTSWARVVQNVIGAAIALFYGLLVPSLLANRSHAPTPTAHVAPH